MLLGTRGAGRARSGSRGRAGPHAATLRTGTGTRRKTVGAAGNTGGSVAPRGQSGRRGTAAGLPRGQRVQAAGGSGTPGAAERSRTLGRPGGVGGAALRGPACAALADLL